MFLDIDLLIIKKAKNTDTINKNTIPLSTGRPGGPGGRGCGGFAKAKPVTIKINTNMYFFIIYYNCVKIIKNSS